MMGIFSSDENQPDSYYRSDVAPLKNKIYKALELIKKTQDTGAMSSRDCLEHVVRILEK